MIAREHTAELLPDPSRVIARLFLPGEGISSSHSRAAEIAARVLTIAPDRVDALAAGLLEDFSARHPDVASVFDNNADAVASRIEATTDLTPNQKTVLGAAFTTEYAVEGAALCNPSAVEHPDQTGLSEGELRVALAVRSIGEGHISSITFAEAIIDAADEWVFGERAKPLVQASVSEGTWSRAHLQHALEHDGYLDELASAVLRKLPERFPVSAVETVIATLPYELTAHRDSSSDARMLRSMAATAYEAAFDPATELSQRALQPVTAEESNGMEDARFVRFTAEDGSAEYRATYTAYSGHDVAPRLITSPDLTSFAVHRLTGDAARNKGMALFPRAVGGSFLALSRTDGERILLARSDDGVVWADSGVVYTPIEPWEVVQSGNCGSPIETADGWLVLTHGVGPMRRYSMGALLLDLDDPLTVLARTRDPIIVPTGSSQDGYVPNVVYSCGGLVHNGVLWMPVGVDDCRVRVFSIGVDELLSSMTRT